MLLPYAYAALACFAISRHTRTLFRVVPRASAKVEGAEIFFILIRVFLQTFILLHTHYVCLLVIKAFGIDYFKMYQVFNDPRLHALAYDAALLVFTLFGLIVQFRLLGARAKEGMNKMMPLRVFVLLTAFNALDSYGRHVVINSW